MHTLIIDPVDMMNTVCVPVVCDCFSLLVIIYHLVKRNQKLLRVCVCVCVWVRF